MENAVNDGCAAERKSESRRRDEQGARPREHEQQILQRPRPCRLTERAHTLTHVLRRSSWKRPQVSHELFELALEIDVSRGHRASSPRVVSGPGSAVSSRRWC